MSSPLNMHSLQHILIKLALVQTMIIIKVWPVLIALSPGPWWLHFWMVLKRKHLHVVHVNLEDN